MTVVICHMSDCKNRSKRKLKKWQMKDGSSCYGCKLKAINIREIFDPDGYMKKVVDKEDMAVCQHYKPKD